MKRDSGIIGYKRTTHIEENVGINNEQYDTVNNYEPIYSNAKVKFKKESGRFKKNKVYNIIKVKNSSVTLKAEDGYNYSIPFEDVIITYE